MSACAGACDPGGCAGPSNTMILLKKLDSMISDNYTLLFVLLVIFAVIGMAMLYFINSLRKTLTTWWKNKMERGKQALDSMAADDPRSRSDDNNNYYMDPKEDPEFNDPYEYVRKEKKDFIKMMDTELDDYNTKKTEYISDTYRKSNDDKIDRTVFYREHDDYKYDDIIAPPKTLN